MQYTSPFTTNSLTTLVESVEDEVVQSFLRYVACFFFLEQFIMDNKKGFSSIGC